MKRILTILITAAMIFSGLPFMTGTAEADALAKKKLPKNITLQAAASGQTEAKLAWNKIKSPGKGYAVFRDGEAIAHLNTKKTAFTDQGLASGTAHTYQIKTYTKKTVKMWFNKKTEKWQKKKPAKKYRGKSRKEAVYTYKKKSNTVRIQTEGPKNNTPSDTSQDNTPADTPKDNTPADTQKNNTPADTPKSNTPADTPKNNTPSDTSQNNTPADTPKDNTPADTQKNNTPADTPKDSTPADTPKDNTPADTPKDNTPADTPKDNTPADASQDNTPADTSITITWKNWDGSILKTTTVQEGTTPSYGGTPTRPDDSFTYTFKGWSPSIVAATRNATYTAEYTPKSKYNYNIKFINEPYGNGGKSVIYIETNNPDPLSMVANATNASGKNVTANVIGIPSDYADVQFTDEDEFYVGNGIPVILGPTEAGQLTFNVEEVDRATNVRIIVASRTVTVKDYKAEEIAWRQRVIQNVCTNSMTNQEKMQAICGYILTNFKYLPTYRGQYVLIFKNEGIPYWVRKEIDSAGSPAALVDFGNDLGYPLENLFTKYKIGTPEWTQYHMCAYSAADDYYYKACPPSDTNIVNPSDITFNPDTYQFWGE